MHVTTLSEYFRARCIPRGLRTHLRPSLLPHNMDFCNKFEAISNKFAFDIMLNFEFLHFEVKDYKKQIDNGEKSLVKILAAQDLKEYMEKTELNMSRFHTRNKKMDTKE